ncbi:MAG TPA: hypothetical protein VK497_05425 [Candidatus Saccharimonadales bacterium]|nr:hypothetical protein [Candidatus Saccharimonadales bacterium]
MKINKNNKKINKYFLWAIILAGVIILYLFIAYFTKLYPFSLEGDSKKIQDQASEKVNDVNYDKPSSEEQKAGAEAKKQSENTPSVYNPPDTSNPTQLAITSSNQQGGVLELRTTISAIDDTGKCTLNFKKTGSSTITQEVGVQNMGSYSVCKGFDISTASLSKGDWTAEITYAGSAPLATISQTVKVQ